MFKSSNPTLRPGILNKVDQSSTPMTVSGAVNKTGLLLLIVVITGTWGWGMSTPGPAILIGLIGGLIAGGVTVFKQHLAPISAPIYAGCQGIALGATSAVFESLYSGIVLQAIGLTVATLFTLLGAYQSGFIKVTDKFRLGVVAATGGIFIIYMLQFILSLFNIQLIGGGSFGLIFSVVVVVIAALNLVLDFDFIETAAARSAPQYMEWYSAFGLMVTLIWLYIEVLNLLARLRNQD